MVTYDKELSQFQKKAQAQLLIRDHDVLTIAKVVRMPENQHVYIIELNEQMG